MNWSVTNPRLFATVRETIDQQFPTLHVVVEDCTVFVRGSLAITDSSSGTALARYHVELEFPPNYPHADPIVRETGGAIPKTVTRHFSADGSACLFLPDARFRSCRRNCTIEEFINGPVRAFLLWQAHHDLTGSVPPSGEWKHGVEGIVQFYSEELGTRDLRVIIGFLELLCAKKAKPIKVCYCGSGKRLRDCHLGTLKTYLDRIPRRTAQNSLSAIRLALRHAGTDGSPRTPTAIPGD